MLVANQKLAPNHELYRDSVLSRVRIGLKIVKLPRLSRRMTKINPMRTHGKLPSLSSYRERDGKLTG